MLHSYRLSNWGDAPSRLIAGLVDDVAEKPTPETATATTQAK